MDNASNQTPTALQLPAIEEEILRFWQTSDTFGQVERARRDAKPFVFYDGPPFATGLPHYGHILQMAIKDAVLRFKTMQGFRVGRKIGWDTHGLPVEYELEKQLNISGKRQIEEYGIERFVAKAREIVLRYSQEWEKTMTRMGRWMDLSRPYATMDVSYIESVWWALKQLDRQGLLYEDYRVGPYCPRCGTVLSNFEVNQGYRDDVDDPSIIVAFKTDRVEPALTALVWTTTPWTLPVNVAIAVNPSEAYVVVSRDGANLLVAKRRQNDIVGQGEVVRELSGRQLVEEFNRLNESRQPSDGHYAPLWAALDGNNYRFIMSEHVTTDEGTGLVHIAPAHGEDDYRLGKEYGLAIESSVEADGTVKQNHGWPGAGKSFKQADNDIISDLASRGLLYQKERIRHTYPHCWRCDSPLLYYPTTSWYVAVTKLKQRLVEENSAIFWNPSHVRDGRFGKWLEGARDWAISRDRYWGAPLPIWRCDSCRGQGRAGVTLVSSRAELAQVSNQKLDDLHRPFIDEITWPCRECQGGTVRRVPYVFDCWFESGAMPFAQFGYPHTTPAMFNPKTGQNYPADFIAEALDQTRGWFYTLHVLGVALFGSKAFKAANVSGLITAADGKKLSKRWRNYIEPDLLFASEGADALRLFFFTKTAMGEDYRFSEESVRDVRRRWITPLMNVVEYIRLHPAGDQPPSAEDELLDQWMNDRVATARAEVIEAMNGSAAPYDSVRACRTFGPLVEDVSTWYVRLSRNRRDSRFIDNLKRVLHDIAVTYAPFMPFVSEYVYQRVADGEATASVHMASMSQLVVKNPKNLEAMAVARALVGAGRELRASHGVPNRQPLASATIRQPLGDALQALIARELNVLRVGVNPDLSDDRPIVLDFTLTSDLKTLGIANELRRKIQEMRKSLGLNHSANVKVFISPIGSDVARVLVQQLTTTQLASSPLDNPDGDERHKEWRIQLKITNQ